MEITVIERIKRLPQQTEESLRDAFSVLMSIEDRKSVDSYVRWVREEARKIRSVDMYELIKRTYFYAGQYDFDSFMIGMEWNREPQARFWLTLNSLTHIHKARHHTALMKQKTELYPTKERSLKVLLRIHIVS